MPSRFHPWRELRALPHVTLEEHDAGEDEHGWTYFDEPPRVSLRAGLLQAERRSTLTHELIHLERGPLAEHPVLDAREEEAVEREAARRLITLDHLVWALQWSGDEHEVAEELWVDVDMVQARLRGLTASERARVEERLDVLDERLEDHE